MIPQIPQFNEISKETSVITNFLLLDENWKNLSIYLKSLNDNLGSVITESLINSIIEAIKNNINQYKKVLPISYNMNISESVNIDEFVVTKISDNNIKIEKYNSPNWETTPLIIQCHLTNTSQVVRPTIIKLQGFISILFDEKISDNFTVIFI